MKPLPPPPPPPICPVCGEDVPPRALACPGCGADERTGWRDEEDTHDSLGLDEDAFDYDDFVRREFDQAPPAPRRSPLWWLTFGLLFVAILLFFVL